ncbi:MAG: hypothetical protein PF961_16285 [Planctomycetota bacterium]|jgi:hypothetical protein|nr:hypothetical protein [Planctomycetota bacterium]
MTRYAVIVVLALCCLSYLSCGRAENHAALADPVAPQDTARATAEALRAGYATADVMQAEIALQVRPANGDSVSFSLKISTDPDLGVVLRGFKKGVSFLDGHLAADGTVELILLRDDTVVRGNLHDAAHNQALMEHGPVALFVTRLGDIIAEVQAGPVPVAERYTLNTTDAGTVLDCSSATLVSRCLLDADGQRVLSKTLFQRDGDTETELLTLSYNRHLVMSGMLRARDVKVSLADNDTRLRFKLANITVPAPGDPLTITVPEAPAEWPVLALDQWLTALTADEPADEAPASAPATEEAP